ncbi:MAG: sigma-70 family RNA polymerase sigma factor [Myxococcales bacterium]|nr:sigma-70 family RNA polymerase sigma factor [Myxococcales bacterium]
MILDSERELVDRCIAQDRGAWAELATKYSGLVYSSIHQTLRTRGIRSSSDQISDWHNGIFLSLYDRNCRKLQQFDGRCRLTTWIKVVSVHFTIDRIRKLGREDVLQEDDDGKRSILDTLVSPNEGAQTQVELEQDLETLRSVVDSLSPQDRRLVEMIFFEELPAADIAAELKTTLGAVYTRKNRLLRKLEVRMNKKLARQEHPSWSSDTDDVPVLRGEDSSSG